jgi:hypothetical protein
MISTNHKGNNHSLIIIEKNIRSKQLVLHDLTFHKEKAKSRVRVITFQSNRSFDWYLYWEIRPDELACVPRNSGNWKYSGTLSINNGKERSFTKTIIDFGPYQALQPTFLKDVIFLRVSNVSW